MAHPLRRMLARRSRAAMVDAGGSTVGARGYFHQATVVSGPTQEDYTRVKHVMTAL